MMNDAWQVGSLADAGLNTESIEDLVLRIENGTFKNVHSVLLVKSGKLVFERYWSGKDSDGEFRTYTAETLHELQSVTKSVTSILVGIAIDRGLIRGVDERVSEFFPEYADIFAGEAKRNIRLRDLLSMTAGLAWEEWIIPYSDPRNDATAMSRSVDFCRYVLEKPMETTPGQRFVYSGGVTLLLGEIVRKASGLSLDIFAERYLFSPLGITDYFWQKVGNGLVNTYGGLRLRPRDMAKIGQLFLDGGRWNGEQMVSKEWVSESTKLRVANAFPGWVKADGYGYQWWVETFEVGPRRYASYSARGRGGQYIIVVPEVEMVVVVTTWNSEVRLLRQPLDMVEGFVLKSMKVEG